MSSYGHFAVEVRTKEKGWQRIIWKTDKSLYPYSLEENEKVDDENYIHRYATVNQLYRLRDSLRHGEFGHIGTMDDFTIETNKDISDFKGEYGWYEGYFYLSELDRFIVQKEQELEKYKHKNMTQAIYDEVRAISARLNNTEFKKDSEENIPFDEYYEEDMEWLTEEIEALKYVNTIISFLVDEACGWTDNNDIRVIIVAG